MVASMDWLRSFFLAVALAALAATPALPQEAAPSPRIALVIANVSYPDAAIARGKVDVALRIPSTTPITYPIAVVTQSKHADEAHAFISFVRSAKGQALLADAGFLAP